MVNPQKLDPNHYIVTVKTIKEIPNVKFTEADSTVSLLKVAINYPTQGGLDFAAIRAHGLQAT